MDGSLAFAALFPCFLCAVSMMVVVAVAMRRSSGELTTSSDSSSESLPSADRKPESDSRLEEDEEKELTPALTTHPFDTSGAVVVVGDETTPHSTSAIPDGVSGDNLDVSDVGGDVEIDDEAEVSENRSSSNSPSDGEDEDEHDDAINSDDDNEVMGELFTLL